MGGGKQLSYRNPPPNHDCENMDMPAVVTPSVNVTDMACVGHVVYTIAFPQLCGLTPTFAWLYIHMSVTRWDVTPRNACLWPQGSSAGAPTRIFNSEGVLVSSIGNLGSEYVGRIFARHIHDIPPEHMRCLSPHRGLWFRRWFSCPRVSFLYGILLLTNRTAPHPAAA